MTIWTSPEQVQKDAIAFMKLMHIILGLYLWEWAISLDFDWAFITGKRKFRWPLAFYFAGRYILLAALIGIVIALDTTSKIDCQGLYTFNQLAGNAAAGLASINLSLRTIAVWGNSRYIIGALILLILGHWTLILQGVLLKAVWVDGVGCAITETNNTVLAATFIYTMCFDLVVLILNVLKLYRPNAAAGSSMATSSKLARMIFKDGVVFFAIAFLANLVATIFMVLNLNQIMTVICNVPAVVASTIVASRVVRRLSTFASRGPQVFPASSNSGDYPGSDQRNKNGGVHVHMETFARTEAAEAPRHKPITLDTRIPSNDDDSNLDIEAKGML